MNQCAHFKQEMQQYFDHLRCDSYQEISKNPRSEKILPLLNDLLYRHTHTFPFENLTSLLAETVSNDPRDILQKFLQGRGGYCYEHSLLSWEILSHLGCEVQPILSRVYYHVPVPEHRPVIGHLSLRITLSNKHFLYDPGFGGATPIQLLQLHFGANQKTPFGEYCFVSAKNAPVPISAISDAEYVLCTIKNGILDPVYAITWVNPSLTDILALSWFTATCPDSIFTTTLMAVRYLPQIKISLSGTTLRIRKYNNTGEEISLKTQSLLTCNDFFSVISGDMGIVLSQSSAQAAFHKLSSPVTQH